jgi:hypothetical protein
MVPGEGIEPPTFGLQNRCSTAELTRHAAYSWQRAAPEGKRPVLFRWKPLAFAQNDTAPGRDTELEAFADAVRAIDE